MSPETNLLHNTIVNDMSKLVWLIYFFDLGIAY